VLVEAEGFQDRGGWVIDQQFIQEMGSPYLLAHGLGDPVADATTEVELPAPGTYRVFVRTKDWVARWNAPGTPGRFQLLVDGKPLETVFGTRGARWFWHSGGTVSIEKKRIHLALHDLTGFEGRCDAILFTSDSGFIPPNDLKALMPLRKKLLGLPEAPGDGGSYDLVVIGGGVAGTCAAVSAARRDLRVALIQNRPVLGGNSSSEVRVWIQGRTRVLPFPRLGGIVRELGPKPRECPAPARVLKALDEKKLDVVLTEENISLFLNTHAFAVEKEGDRIAAVLGKHIASGRELRFRGRWFADCTGDGTIGALAGADNEVLRKGHMGPTNLWRPEDTGRPAPFPRCPWALDLEGKPFPRELDRLGKWFWESGFSRDPLAEVEYIRDWNLRAMYGAWDDLKNNKKLYPNHRIVWAAYIAGKRESRRLLGDVILTKEDVVGGKKYPDGCVPSTWKIDLHVPDPRYAGDFEGDEFISVARYTDFKKPYLVPYRCLYSRNIPNLFMAGRDISVTHEALGTVRVMGTCGMMGEVVGMAASICKQRDCTPRDVYGSYLAELLDLVQGPPGKAELFLKEAGRNLAPLARVTTSGDSDPEKSPPALLTDGKSNTWQNELRWLSEARVPNWVEFSWEKPVNIRRVRIVSGYHGEGGVGSPISEFVFQEYSGGRWRDIPGGSVRENRESDWFGELGPVTADRIRLLVRETPSNISRIWEIALCAPAAQ